MVPTPRGEKVASDVANAVGGAIAACSRNVLTDEHGQAEVMTCVQDALLMADLERAPLFTERAPRDGDEAALQLETGHVVPTDAFQWRQLQAEVSNAVSRAYGVVYVPDAETEPVYAFIVRNIVTVLCTVCAGSRLLVRSDSY
jgi:hypothetical protein